MSQKMKSFPKSAISEMTVLCEKYGAVNLASGSPDFPAPEDIKKAAAEAIFADHNYYGESSGIPALRNALATRLHEYNGIEADPDNEITVTCGSTESVAASLLAIIDPGDEIIIFEPFYENYVPMSQIIGGKTRFVTLEAPNFKLDSEKLKSVFNSRTKTIVLNTPNNPTGKVFNKDDLKLIADLCMDYNAIAITDEVYEHIFYGDHTHTSLATLGHMYDNTITISSFSKTYTVPGWRLGYSVASKELSNLIRKVHEYLTITPPTPLQYGAIVALNQPKSYYVELRRMYSSKKELMLEILRNSGFNCISPEGATYVWSDFSEIDECDDFEFATRMIKEVGVAGVPGSSFFNNPNGKDKIRFTFQKKDETLKEAEKRFGKLMK